MEFCPTCKTLLKKSNNKLVCPKCEYVKKIDKPIKEKSAESDPDFLVMEESDMKKDQGLKSTIKIDCEKCHNQEGVWWSKQTYKRHCRQTWCNTCNNNSS